MSGTEIIGGIKFNTKDIDKKVASDNTFSVTLTDGTTINYLTQSEERCAEIEIMGTGRIEFRGIEKATITDTPQNDVYILAGCDNVIVYADGGTNNDNLYSSGNDQDFVEVKNRKLPDGSIQYSKDNVLKLNKDDLYQLANSDNVHIVNKDSTDILED